VLSINIQNHTKNAQIVFIKLKKVKKKKLICLKGIV